MSFYIDLYTNSSENNKVDKSLTPIASYSCTLRDSTSIIDPSFVLAVDVSDVVSCNYAYVSDFGRYYYVRNIISLRNGVCILECHVDVLMSFASEIRSNKGIVRKQENGNAYNLYIDDGSLVAYQDPYVLTEVFPSGFSGACFVLLVAGSGGSNQQGGSS